jgi:hypothetical protein
MELVYGDWPSTWITFTKYMLALQYSNPRTIVKWKYYWTSVDDLKAFHFLFYTFKPLTVGFKYCRPVISRDGTHLRGLYRGKLLVASTWDTNNHLFPLAFVIVDEESLESWSWFLKLLRHHVIFERHICLILDKQKAIINVVCQINEWQEPLAFHRYCLGHIKANFYAKFKYTNLTNLMYVAGLERKKIKCQSYYKIRI